jgi:hypothetical protein
MRELNTSRMTRPMARVRPQSRMGEKKTVLNKMSSDILSRLHTTVSNTNPYFGSNTKVIRKNNKGECTRYVV